MSDPVQWALAAAGRSHVPLVATGASHTVGALAQLRDNYVEQWHSLGIGAGTRVQISLPEGPQWVASWAALWKLGAVIAATDPASTPRANVQKRFAPNFVVDSDGLLHCNGAMERIGIAGEPENPYLPNPATVLWTSGTTGEPKGYIHGSRGLQSAMEALQQHLGIATGDRILCVAPWTFGYGLGMGFLLPMISGAASIALTDRKHASVWVRTATEQQATVWALVPSVMASLLRSGIRERSLPHPPRLVLSAGEPLPPALGRAWVQAFPASHLVDGLGSTELFHIHLANPVSSFQPGRIGQPLRGYNARVRREDGTLAATGEVGRLHIHGPSVATGVWASPEQIHPVDLVDGSFPSMDLASVMPDGSFRLHGRADDQFKVRGKWVQPTRVEAALLELPGMVECAVVAVDRGDGLQRPGALVVMDDDIPWNVETLASHAQSQLQSHEVPVVWVPSEAVPRNSRGKIDRKAAVQHFSKGTENPNAV